MSRPSAIHSTAAQAAGSTPDREPEPAAPVAVRLEQVQQQRLWAVVQQAAQQQGFTGCGVSDVDLRHTEAGLQQWLAAGMHGSMHYMERHGSKRTRPDELLPGTVRVISLRMPYLYGGNGGNGGNGSDVKVDVKSNVKSDVTGDEGHEGSGRHGWQQIEWGRLRQPAQGVVSLYARGRDYHKVLRKRLQYVADAMLGWLAEQGITDGVACRVFTDSAPVMEVAIAEKSGVGWRGKHTLALHRTAGSMFFLGEIYTSVPLPLTQADIPRCGSCTACMDVCPTQAITAPYTVDARRCISYLTIEYDGSIPLALRPLMGNRIYGCDDCQLTCPWNKYAQPATVPDFAPRDAMHGMTLVEYLLWDEATFLRMTEGSAIRRIGHRRWQRNVAVAMGNALRTGQPGGLSEAERGAVENALHAVLQRDGVSELVAEHVRWALHSGRSSDGLTG